MARAAIAKHDAIANEIRQRILTHELKPGDAIPSYRMLMQHHNVAVATVRQAISSLQYQGFITPHSGKGCVVLKRAAKWSHIGLGILGRVTEPLLLETLELMQGELEKHHLDVSVRTSAETDQPQLTAFTEWAGRQQGLLLAGRLTTEIIRQINRAGVPIVVISVPMDGECPVGVSAVLPDEDATIDVSVSHLAGLGHQRILFINPRPSWHTDKLSARFHTMGERMHMKGSFAELRWDFDSLEEERKLPEYLSRLSEAPTALLVEGGMRASRIVDHLNEQGWPVPERISVLAISAMVGGRHVRPDLAAVVVEFPRMFTRATGVLSSLAREGSSVAHVERIAPGIVMGRTCRAVAAG